MAKQSQVKSKRKLLNPVFHQQTKEEDDRQLTEGMIKVVRKTGQLNLSRRSLATVPKKMFSMYDVQGDPTIVSFDLSKPPEDPWWSFNPLTYLDLSSNVLHCIPKEIKIFEDLTVLNLQDNCLTELPSEIGALTKLTKINLNHNKISALPKEFYKLTELQQLFLAHNNLEILTDDIGDLIMLNQLDLSYNNLTILPAGVGFMVRLTEINLSNNKLTELPPDIISLRVLNKLDVTHNNLKALPRLYDMRKLQLLYAQHNDIEELPELEGCENVQELHFGNNFITELTKEFCENATHLRILDLRDNKIEKLPDEIAMFQNLIRLDLTNNDLETLPNTLCLMPHLQNLQVEGNKLKQIRSDIIKAGISRLLKHLREKLDLENHPLQLEVEDHTSNVTVHNFPNKYIMRQCRALSLAMQDLSRVPDNVFEEAEKAEVTTVDLSKNKFTAVPKGIQNVAANITELILSSNQLKSIPDSISDCVKLQYLDLSKNLLTALPESLKFLERIRELVLSNNKFASLPECVYEMRGLEILQACDNQIAQIDMNGLSQLKYLATLDLANNNINFVPPHLGNMKQLRFLELRGNSFRQPRYAILEQGTETILSYLRDRIPQ